ncbi:MAG: hypothetical protein H3C26_01515 [Rhodocyclaceae bacterium]|nr:hypothetical protein [Rhodocyclaceae bacterium]
MKVRIGWLLLVGAFACLAIYFGDKYFRAAPSGYCEAQGRHISDEEFIQLAIKLREQDWIKRGGQEKFTYSGRDFDPKHFNCCRVIREESFSLFNRMFDRQEISVELNNETSTVNIYQANLNDRLFFDVCGRLKGRIEYDWQAQ